MDIDNHVRCIGVMSVNRRTVLKDVKVLKNRFKKKKKSGIAYVRLIHVIPALRWIVSFIYYFRYKRYNVKVRIIQLFKKRGIYDVGLNLSTMFY